MEDQIQKEDLKFTDEPPQAGTMRMCPAFMRSAALAVFIIISVLMICKGLRMRFLHIFMMIVDIAFILYMGVTMTAESQSCHHQFKDDDS
jgi:hypothetical protein